MNSQDDALLQLPFGGAAEATLVGARRRMDLAAASSWDEAREYYERQALQLYQEGRIMDREMAVDPAYADLQAMWVDAGSDIQG